MVPLKSISDVRAFVREKLVTDAAFQRRDHGRRWVCPYCRKVVEDIEISDDSDFLLMDAPQKMAHHLLEDCAPFKAGEPIKRRADEQSSPERDQPSAMQLLLSQPRLPDLPMAQPVEDDTDIAAALEAELSETVVDTSQSLREATAETSSWLLDNEGKESSAPNATSDSLPSERGATSDSNPVDSKLKTNPELSTSTPRIMRVRTAGRAPDRKELDQLVAQVRRRMQEDDILRQRDNRNRWFCPYCGKTCRDILFPDELALALQDTPFQIGDHLLRDCPAYKAEFEPSKRLAGDDHQEKAWQAGMHEARRRQRYMLPAKLPEVPGLDFECFFQPADYISGDFYDVIRVSEHELGIVIGDVAGHGIEAAIVMAMARKLIQVHGRGRSSAADTLCVVNADLADDLGEGVFLSAFYGVLDTRSFYMTCASAGHTPPLIYHAEHPVEVTRVSPRGLAIGLDRGPRFTRLIEEWVIELQPGDFFVSYTDGVIERENAEGEELGVDGLSDLVRKYGYRRPADALRQILSGVDKFADKPPDDDITLLSFRCYEVEDDDLGEEITAGQDATSP